jgi:hypothetical protein
VQSVLNTAFLDLELLSEWTFRMGTASIAVQLLPVQVEKMTVAGLKRRFWEDVLARHGVKVPLSAVRLVQGKRAVLERRRLRDLDRREFRVAFTEKATISVAEALETLRHRIRTRWTVPPTQGALTHPKRHDRAAMRHLRAKRQLGAVLRATGPRPCVVAPSSSPSHRAWSGED